MDSNLATNIVIICSKIETELLDKRNLYGVLESAICSGNITSVALKLVTMTGGCILDIDDYDEIPTMDELVNDYKDEYKSLSGNTSDDKSNTDNGDKLN
jgi:hypothetical protein